MNEYATRQLSGGANQSRNKGQAARVTTIVRSYQQFMSIVCCWVVKDLFIRL